MLYLCKEMKIVIAPDSFKECLPAREVARIIAQAAREARPGSEVVTIPLADGGEGTLDVLLPALGGQMEVTTVSDPLGRPVQARFGMAGETAVIETAQACGLMLLRPEERRPLIASTRGVGELLLAARRKGCTHFLVGLGGSATCDGGAGMMTVPGLREAMQGTTVELLCDVDAPFVGPAGAARVFGPQKGATPAEVELLEARMAGLARSMAAQTGVDPSNVPGAGAAGGLGGAMMAYFGARKQSGIERVLALTGFDQAVTDASLVITGEGKSDRQTLQGKAAVGVLRHAGDVPVALVSGRLEDAPALKEAGFRYLAEVSPRAVPLEEALRPEVAGARLFEAVLRLLR